MAGSYDKTPQGTWRGRVMIRGRRHQVTRRTKREAESAIADIVRDAERQGIIDPGRRRRSRTPTVAQHLDEWLLDRAEHLAPATAVDYRRAIDSHITPHIGPVQLDRLHQTDLNDLYRTLRAGGLGAARIRRVHNILAAALEQAAHDDLVLSNVARKARPPKVTERPIDPPTPGDVVRIVSVADTVRPGLSMFVHLAAVTGARRGELLALRWSDIDADTVTIARSISVATGRSAVGTGLVEKDTKTHAVRRLKLDPGTMDALGEHADWQSGYAVEYRCELAPDPRLFTSDPEGVVPWRPDGVSRDFRRAVEAAGLSGVRLHDLRHAAATQLMAAGVDAVTSSGRLGHKRRDTFLNRYAHVVPAADSVAAATLGAIYGRTATEG